MCSRETRQDNMFLRETRETRQCVLGKLKTGHNVLKGDYRDKTRCFRETKERTGCFLRETRETRQAVLGRLKTGHDVFKGD